MSETPITEPNQEIKSAPIPIPGASERPLAGQERMLCSCGKNILKKNILVHEKTKVHLDSLLPESDEVNEVTDETTAPKKDPTFKLKKEFANINSKLDYVIEIQTEILNELYYEDDGSDTDK